MPLEINPEIKELVLRARAFCEEEKRLGRPLIPFKSVRRRVAALTGVSEKTITRVTRADILRRAGLREPTAYKPRKRKVAPVVDIELPLADTIRTKIREIRLRDETLTVNKLLSELKEDVGFKGSRTSLWKILKRMGVKTGKKTDEDVQESLPQMDIQNMNMQVNGMHCAEITELQRNSIQSTDMQNANMQSTNMQSTNMQSTNMQSTDMQSVGIQSADMQNSEFVDNILGSSVQSDTSIQDTIQHIAAATDAVKRESYDYFCEPAQLCSVEIQPLE